MPILFPLVRGVIFVALLLIIGTSAASDLVRREARIAGGPERSLRGTLRRLQTPVLFGLIIAILCKGALQILSFRDPGEPVTRDLFQAVLDSGWGRAWIFQLSASVLFLGWTWRARHREGFSSVVPAFFTGVIVWTQSGMGHAASSKWTDGIGRALDSIHLLGLGLWLGTLAALTIAAFPSLRGDDRLPALARVVRAFSWYARVGVALVVLSGLIESLVYVGPIAMIAQSAWGRLLLIKLALMLGVLALGWYNWRIVTPALDGAHPTARVRLRNAVRLELLLGVAMLAITALLVASPLPGEG